MRHSVREIAFVGTGGTIASLGRDRFDVLDYGATGEWLDTAALIEQSELDGAVARIRPVEFSRIDSTAMVLEDWVALAHTCVDLAADSQIAGIVIGHGTASLEETAWCLSLVLHLSIPVVLTGSMRPFNGLSSDAHANLAAALRVAQSPVGGQVLTVLNDEIHAPRDVRKMDTTTVSAFRSDGSGPIGHVRQDIVAIDRILPMAPALLNFKLADLEAMPRVDICHSHIDADGVAIRAFVAAGARGIVSAGFGPGMATPAETEALAEAARNGIIVVQATRGLSGRVLDSTGNRARGIISAGALSAEKARILLALCLARGDGHAQIARAFAAA